MENIRGPFRAGEAVRAGRITRGRLAGPSTVRLFPNVQGFRDEAPSPVDTAGRARAAALSVADPPPVIGGFTAADLLDASCGPLGAPVELVVGSRRVRARPGVTIRQDVLREDDVLALDDLLVTTPERTAWDLARRLGFTEGVVALDALARVGSFPPEALLARPRGGRGCAGLAEVVAAADPRAASPPETRVRLLFAQDGIVGAEPQIEVHDEDGVFVGRVDLGFREHRVAVEYQGDEHRSDRRQWRRDQARIASLAAVGWVFVPCTGDDLLGPRVFLRRVRAALAHRQTVRR